jgi:hypothetical protein
MHGEEDRLTPATRRVLPQVNHDERKEGTVWNYATSLSRSMT